MTPRTLVRLQQLLWPGTLRELENWIARVVILGNQEAPLAGLEKPIALHGALDPTTPCVRSDSAFQPRQLAGAVTLKVLPLCGCRGRSVPGPRIGYRVLLGRPRPADTTRRRKVIRAGGCHNRGAVVSAP